MGRIILPRRRFLRGSLILVGLGLLPGCGMLPRAQPAARTYRLAYLGVGSPHVGSPSFDAAREALRELGWVEGENLALEYRWAETPGELPGLAAELAALPVDVIFVGSGVTALGAKAGTGTVPIVMAASNDADQVGLVASLAHPGGNVTGLTVRSVDLVPKQTQLLIQAVPGVSRMTILWTRAHFGWEGTLPAPSMRPACSR